MKQKRKSRSHVALAGIIMHPSAGAHDYKTSKDKKRRRREDKNRCKETNYSGFIFG